MGLQYAMFYLVKGRELHAKRRPFSVQFTAFENIVDNKCTIGSFQLP